VGGTVYGMIGTDRNPGFDEPFAFDHDAGSFITISGVTADNVPTTQPTTGDWNPPTIAAIGTKLIITHPGFDGNVPNARFIGVLDVSNPAAPAWSSANLAGNPLPSPPSSVANLNNRAWYVIGPKAYYSDVLLPTTATNAGQVITVGDPSTINALSGLPVSTTSAGIVQALLAFKDNQIWQITGDPILSNLALNFLSLTVGSPSPRSIVPTPIGTVFIATDGPYYVDPLGVVRPLTKQPGEMNQDIQKPFQFAQNRSRTAAGFSNDVYRVCLDTIIDGNQATNEYWFDMSRRRWVGPQSFPVDCYSTHEDHFMISHRSKPGAIFHSRVMEVPNATFFDEGASFAVQLESSAFPKLDEMAIKQVVESTIELSSGGAVVSYFIEALDQSRQTMQAITIKSPPVSGLLWGGGALWGDGSVYVSVLDVPLVTSIPWREPLVFQKMGLRVTATGISNLEIGTFYARWQFAGYLGA
jgi:hypothetical protein